MDFVHQLGAPTNTWNLVEKEKMCTDVDNCIFVHVGIYFSLDHKVAKKEIYIYRRVYFFLTFFFLPFFPDLNRKEMGVFEGHQVKGVEIQGLNYGPRHKNQSISGFLTAEMCQQNA
jgi:hypothetical protein